MDGLPAEPRRVFGLPQQRQKAVEVLNHCYTNDLLDLTEFEARLALVEKATTLDDLDRILADIPEEHRGGTPAVGVSEAEAVVTKMTTKKVTDGVLLTKSLVAEVSMGTLVLDYRRLALPAGVLEVRLKAVMATCHIYLPAGVQVEIRIDETLSTIHEQPDYALGSQKPATILKVTGVSQMSTVRIHRRSRLALWWEGVRGPKSPS